jgi:NAD(P)-dependent dehydrogenase (short-subunit alcohol dehydrogenase family)
LASEGFLVYCGVRKEKDKKSIMDMHNANLIPIVFDVTKHETNVDAIATISAAMASSGLPFVALVNNAGVSRRMAAEFHDMEDIHRVFETNVFGLMDLTQLSLSLLRQSKGRIVMISSVNGKLGESQFTVSQHLFFIFVHYTQLLLPHTTDMYHISISHIHYHHCY